MPSRPSIFDHNCKPLAEINAATTPRVWTLNDYGDCDFSMSTSDPKCTEQILQYGNMLFIEHIPSKDETGTIHGKLPDWVGFIFCPRTWDLGVVHNSAYSAEALLSYRPMPFVDVKGSPAQIFTQIIGLANSAPSNIKFNLGIVEDLPLSLSDTLRTSAYAHIRTLCEKSGMDWNVTAEIGTKGELILYANLYRRIGVNTSLSLTSDNTELGSPLLSEQGNISNYIIGYNQANTPQSRKSAVAIHESSLADYGYFGINTVHMGMRDEADILAPTHEAADSRGRPRKTLQKIGVLDWRDTFAHLAPGNTVLRQDNNAGFRPGGGFGFDARARILSVDYNDLSNKCATNLEVLYT
jgi:hypothetical protein